MMLIDSSGELHTYSRRSMCCREEPTHVRNEEQTLFDRMGYSFKLLKADVCVTFEWPLKVGSLKMLNYYCYAKQLSRRWW